MFLIQFYSMDFTGMTLHILTKTEQHELTQQNKNIQMKHNNT